jgi:hypothetical protein
MMHGPEETISWLAVGLPIPHAPHFLITDIYVRHSRISNLMEIGANPALTHVGTGLRVSQRLESIDQASKIAVVLEALPVCWDGTVEEMRASLAAMPQVLQRWLQVEVSGHAPREAKWQ